MFKITLKCEITKFCRASTAPDIIVRGRFNSMKRYAISYLGVEFSTKGGANSAPLRVEWAPSTEHKASDTVSCGRRRLLSVLRTFLAVLFVVTGFVTGAYIVTAAGTVHVCSMTVGPPMAAFVRVLPFLRACKRLLSCCFVSVKRECTRGGEGRKCCTLGRF